MKYLANSVWENKNIFLGKCLENGVVICLERWDRMNIKLDIKMEGSIK